MTIDRRKFEWNLNTIIQLVTLAGMIIGGVTLWVNQSRDIEDLQGWRAGHEQMHKERFAENKAFQAKIEGTQRTTQVDLVNMQRKADNVEYRVTVLETGMASQQAQQQRIAELLSEVQGDMKVVKELLQRMDAANKRQER